MHTDNKNITGKITWRVAFACFAAIILWNCSPAKDTAAEENRNQAKEILPEAPDYAQAGNWWNLQREGAEADVFYVLPTCVWDWTDQAGNTVHYANTQDEEQREAMRPSLELAAGIFNSHNFYAPYYRQITLESWMEGDSVIEARFAHAMPDVEKAFDYYLVHENDGRPFILAGFSQGAKAVVELLKTLPDDARQRLIAAYVIGYRVTSQELAQYPEIRAARDSADTGVTVCYNSVASPEAISPALSPSCICINPVNWRTDAIPARLNDTATVRVDTLHHVLLVEGLDETQYYHPSLEKLFKPGNYHLQELLFYQPQLRHNATLRTRHYFGATRP